MGAIKDLFASERGFFALILVIGATVLTGLGQMTVDQWRDFSMTIFGIYVGGKTITGAVGLMRKPAEAPDPSSTVAFVRDVDATPASVAPAEPTATTASGETGTTTTFGAGTGG